ASIVDGPAFRGARFVEQLGEPRANDRTDRRLLLSKRMRGFAAHVSKAGITQGIAEDLERLVAGRGAGPFLKCDVAAGTHGAEKLCDDRRLVRLRVERFDAPRMGERAVLDRQTLEF